MRTLFFCQVIYFCLKREKWILRKGPQGRGIKGKENTVRNEKGNRARRTSLGTLLLEEGLLANYKHKCWSPFAGEQTEGDFKAATAPCCEL